jgi:hypothetical protein
VVHQLLTTEYLFWLVALAFYFLDSIKLVSKSQILIIETITGKFKPSFSFNTFEIKGQQVQLLNLFSPFTGFFRLDSSPNQSPSINFENTKQELVELQQMVLPFKLISIISFVYLLIGPVLTFYYGLGATLLFLLPLHLTSLLILLTLLLISRKKFGFTYGVIASIFFDCLVVPAYLPNIVRKIFSKKVFLCDGYFFALNTCLNKDREELEYNITRKIAQMSDYQEDFDPKKNELYLKLLGIKYDK